VRAHALALAGLALAVLPGAAQPGRPERIVAALNQTSISITASFEGSEIGVFGAVAREAPVEPDAPTLGVVVRIAGPSEPVIVRRKARVAGVWANVAAERIDRAPSFYAVAASGPLHDKLSHTEDLRHRVSFEHALRFVGAQSLGRDRDAYLEAAVRLRREAGLYVLAPGGVDLFEDTLFRAAVALPANIVEGAYTVTVLLTRDRRVIDIHQAEIEVAKAGLERIVYDLSRQQPLLYGALAILVALAAGLAASEAFRWLRR
jgi:uncharacterized protein (TIGR02186 family)